MISLCPHRKTYKYCGHKISMAYTEIRNINGRKYYYRVISIRKGKEVSKKRVYLGSELLGPERAIKERKADEKLLFKVKRPNKEIEKIKSKIIEILKKNSDIDIAVEIDDKNMGLIGFIGLKIALEDYLGRKVDLVEYSAIKKLIKDRILNEEIRII